MNTRLIAEMFGPCKNKRLRHESSLEAIRKVRKTYGPAPAKEVRPRESELLL